MPETHLAFFDAIRRNDLAAVRAMLETDGGLVNQFDERSFGSPPVTTALRAGQPMIDLLIDSGADPNTPSDWWAGGFHPIDFADEATARHLMARGARLTGNAAARLGWTEELKSILEADPEAANRPAGDGQCPLHVAKNVEVAKILVEAGAEIDKRDVDHEGTPAQYQLLNTEIVEYLLSCGAIPDIYMAIAMDDLPMISSFMTIDPECVRRKVTDPGNPMIPQAPGQHIYTYLIGDSRPLQAASRLGRTESYRFLFERSPADVQFLAALWAGDRDLALRVLAEHPNVLSELSSKDRGTITEAAWQGRNDAVLLMLDVGFPVDSVNEEAMTPLMSAAFQGNAVLVEEILKRKPSLTLRNTYGGTPLSTCLYATLNQRNPNGDYARVVKALLDEGSELTESMRGSEDIEPILASYRKSDQT